MTWKSALRSIAAESRRVEKENRQQQRQAYRDWMGTQKELARAATALAKQAERAAAEQEVAAFEAHIDLLTSVHRSALNPIDWNAILHRAKPAPPHLLDELSEVARAEDNIRAHSPGFFKRAFGTASRELRALNEALDEAKLRSDEARRENERRMQQHEQELIVYREQVDLADRVLKRDIEAYTEVLRELGSLQELAEMCGPNAINMELFATRAEVWLTTKEDEVVPKESKQLSARGVVNAKKLPDSKRAEIYQDYVCGAALRIARELFAAIPIDRALVHIMSPGFNTSTGHMVLRTLLSVDLFRSGFQHIVWENVDASDLVSKFRHAMKMKRGKPMEPVEKLDWE